MTAGIDLTSFYAGYMARHSGPVPDGLLLREIEGELRAAHAPPWEIRLLPRHNGPTGLKVCTPGTALPQDVRHRIQGVIDRLVPIWLWSRVEFEPDREGDNGQDGAG